MASRIIGRAACPECGFEHAHIKESERCIYRYCPACGINGPHARTKLQRDNMVKGMRPVEPTGTPTPTEAKPAPAAAPAAPTPTPSKRREASPPADPPPAPPSPPTSTPARRSGLFGFSLGE
jgi:hypothetical protein